MKFLQTVIIFILTNLVLSLAWAQIPNDIDTELITSASYNVGIRHANDGSGRKFIIGQQGDIRIIDANDNVLATPFLDISGQVRCCGERGLLGLAFHPNYAQNGYFFINYTKSGTNLGDTIVARYQVSAGDPNIADASSGQVLMRIIQDYSNHNGGNMHFGQDGYLYIGMGDGGSGGDPEDRAQDLASALGKMLRIDVDTNNAPQHAAPGTSSDPSCPQDTSDYAIPNDNPFANTQGACPEIWAYGLRNPWRWSFDRQTGDMYIGDVGQNNYEEVSFQAASSTGGEHYGWNCREGAHDYNGGADCDANPPPMVEPIIEYTQGGGRCAVTGGYVYRGPVSSLQGTYLYADYCTGQIWLDDLSGNGNQSSSTEWLNHGATGLVSSFGEDEEGNLYISTSQNYGSESTFIYRITGDVDNDLIFENGFE